MSVLQCRGGQRHTSRLQGAKRWPHPGCFLLLRNSKIKRGPDHASSHVKALGSRSWFRSGRLDLGPDMGTSLNSETKF